MTASSCSPVSLTDLSSPALTRRLAELLGEERRCLVEVLLHLAEVDRRSLHLELGFSSLFAYCTGPLKLTNASAWRRTTSARLMARFPVIADYLADGRLCLSTLVHLREVLEPGNHRDLLDQASFKTEDDLRLLVATLRPRPEVPTSIRRLPARANASASGPEVQVGGAGPRADAGGFSAPLEASHAPSAPDLFRVPAPGGPLPAVHAPVARPRIEPLDAERHSLRMTVGREFLDELAQVKAALSHVVPDGNLEALLRVCFQKTLNACAKQKHAARSPSRRETLASTAVPPAPTSGPERSPAGGTGAAYSPRTSGPERASAQARGAGEGWKRHLSAEVRRAVRKRDGGSCSFVGTNGQRCNSTHQLEFDHEVPFARGGASTVEGISLRCRAHNLHRARRHFGAVHMAKFARSTSKSAGTASSPVDPTSST